MPRITKAPTAAEKARILLSVKRDAALIEVARKAIEDVLVGLRDSRIGTLRNNGLVIAEKDGERSSIVRLGSDQAMEIGLAAMAVHLKKGGR